MIDVCILWGWCLHVFWTMLCLLYSGAYHVFLWSMWWLAQACKLGIVMLLILVHVLLLFWCHVNLMLQSDPCIFLRYFSKGVLNMWLLSIHSCPLLQLWSSLACHFRALLLLQNVSWQIVYVLFNLGKVVIVDPCMLWTCSWLGLFHKHVFLMMLCLYCHAMTCGDCIELVK